ncbi:MAG: phosphatase PAP2 family protein, partial [Thermoguttaceae bacterium]|nr:phosphatase PAP2 family protein [Thermoguttaceae bacterium]
MFEALLGTTPRRWTDCRKQGKQSFERHRQLRCEPLEDRRMLAITPFLLQDINLFPADVGPEQIVAVGDVAFFTADLQGVGRELWKSDGTEAGTELVMDINPGAASSTPQQLTVLDDMLYFTAETGAGRELWKSDGTEAGTALVKDINLGTDASNPQYLTVAGDTLFFGANNGASGYELWKSDGTEAGTELVKDVRPGTAASDPQNLTAVGSTLYFTAITDAGRELWKSDGTEAGTVMVKDIRLGSASPFLAELTAVGSTLYFRAENGANGWELWKSDGTEAGTVMVKDIRLGADSSNPWYLTAVGNTLFFRADDGVNGAELWLSNGTPAGTVMVSDLLAGAGASNPQFLTAVGNSLFFTAQTATGRELWKSDGTAFGTVLVKDLLPGAGSSDPLNLTAVGNTLFFTAETAAGRELWTSDGTEAGTVLVEDILPGASASMPVYLTAVGNSLFFRANDGANGPELWTSDGTAAGTVLLGDIHVHTQGSAARDFVEVGGLTFFVADNGVSGAELWKSDGTEAGTEMVLDILPGGVESDPQELTAMNGVLFFTAATAAGRELWRSDGTAAGTMLVKDIWPGASSDPRELTVVGNELFFRADDGVNGWELWKSDGTEEGTVLVKNILPGPGPSYPQYLTAVGDKLFFEVHDGVNGHELWISDGTEAGTKMVKDIRTGLASSWPDNLTAVGDTLFFRAQTDTEGAELWRSDGTEAGTFMVLDILPGAQSSNPWSLTALGDTLFFRAFTNTHGWELWKSDGTVFGTEMVKDILPGAGGADPDYLTVVGDTLYFRANDGVNGTELWRTDGTDAGTVLVKNIQPGAASSWPESLTAVGNTLFFVAYTNTNGWELWQSDGTDAGTVLVQDVMPGPGASSPNYLSAVDGTLYFRANDGYSGAEPWVLLTVEPPVVTALTADPNPLTRPGNLTLTATGVSDPDGTVDLVAFYRDTNGDGLLDAGDEPLGTDVDGNDGWSLTVASAGWNPGEQTLFARAQDNDGALSDPAVTTVTVLNVAPVVTALTADPDPVTRPDDLTLTATGVSDPDGTVNLVEFYRDTNGDGLLDAGDELLGTITHGHPDLAVQGDIVTEWNMTAMSLGPNVGTHAAGRYLAMMHTAIYDTLMAFDGGYHPFQVSVPTPEVASPEAAAATAAYHVLHSVYTAPAQRVIIQSRYDIQMALIADGAAKTAGVAFGQSVAQAILDSRANDGAAEAANVPHPDGTQPGEWRRTASGEPLLPGWGDVMPWVMTAGDQFDQGGPPALNSVEYAAAYDEVRLLGDINSTTRTVEQGEIALFWMDHVPAHWNRLAREIAEQGGLSLVDTARLFALMSVTLADANIAAWNMKYEYNFWRPETAIQLGDADTNDDTVGDPGWESLLVAPAFPEYVSGHSSISGAAAELLELYLGHGNYDFMFMHTAHPELGMRTYGSFSEAAEEAGMSRIYGGIHFQFGNQDGLQLGRDLAQFVYGSSMTTVSDWSLTVATTGWDLGEHTLFARAQDSDGAWSEAAAATVVVVDVDNVAPTVAALTADPDPVTRPDELTLTATGVSDPDGTVSLVEFYRDANGNDLFDAGDDELLGTDVDGNDGWSVTVATGGWTSGEHTLFARALDNEGLLSDPATTTVTVLNVVPVMAALTADPNPLTRPGNLTLTATGVSDPDGTVDLVEFYRDTNGDGLLDAGDELLGTDTDGNDGWSL